MLFNIIYKKFPNLGEKLRESKQNVYHRLKIYPIYNVIKRINHKFPLKGCIALEAFARTGSWQARAYQKYPKSLDAWEIDPWCKPFLEKNLPKAKIKITDSILEIKKCETKFNFINVDTHQGIYGPYCEHFEFYPLIFKCLMNEAVVILNTIPHADLKWRKLYGDLFNAEHNERRKNFYKTNNPENISFDEMINVYDGIARQNGYFVNWNFFQKRTLTYYCVLHLKKIE